MRTLLDFYYYTRERDKIKFSCYLISMSNFHPRTKKIFKILMFLFVLFMTLGMVASSFIYF